jgi:hypothetical protein
MPIIGRLSSASPLLASLYHHKTDREITPYIFGTKCLNETGSERWGDTLETPMKMTILRRHADGTLLHQRPFLHA